MVDEKDGQYTIVPESGKPITVSKELVVNVKKPLLILKIRFGMVFS